MSKRRKKETKLLDLPSDIIGEIFFFLTINDIDYYVQYTCKMFHNIFINLTVPQKIADKKFPKRFNKLIKSIVAYTELIDNVDVVIHKIKMDDYNIFDLECPKKINTPKHCICDFISILVTNCVGNTDNHNLEHFGCPGCIKWMKCCDIGKRPYSWCVNETDDEIKDLHKKLPCSFCGVMICNPLCDSNCGFVCKCIEESEICFCCIKCRGSTSICKMCTRHNKPFCRVEEYYDND
jgi:hypothetical protein